MKELIVHPEALAELESGIEWYESRRSGLGGEFNDAVEAVFEQIKASPGLGWRYGDKGHRVPPRSAFPI